MAAAASLLGTVGACSLLVASPDLAQCSGDPDCTRRFGDGSRCVDRVCQRVAADAGGEGGDGGSADPTWGCLGSVSWARPDLNEMATLNVQFVRLVGRDAIPDLVVSACDRIDPDCRSTPADAGVMTDDAGRASLRIAKGFDGFLKADPPPSFSSMMPALWFALPPPSGNVTVAAPITLVSAQDIDLITKLASKPPVDPALGHLLTLTTDCQGRPAAGVALKASHAGPTTIQYYTNSTGDPTTEAFETGQTGQAGFINLPVGPLTLEATVPSLGKRVGSYNLLIRAGHATYAPIPPAP